MTVVIWEGERCAQAGGTRPTEASAADTDCSHQLHRPHSISNTKNYFILRMTKNILKFNQHKLEIAHHVKFLSSTVTCQSCLYSDKATKICANFGTSSSAFPIKGRAGPGLMPAGSQPNGYNIEA